jgi:hypothetical protein
MLPFSDRSKNTVNIKYKSIKKGFKMWVLADQGYVYNWLWFNGYPEKGIEVIGKKNWKFKINKNGIIACFASTFTVIIYLI